MFQIIPKMLRSLRVAQRLGCCIGGHTATGWKCYTRSVSLESLGGKVVNKKTDVDFESRNSEAIAAACAMNGDYEKIEQIIEKSKKATIELYNSLIRAYIKTQLFGKIALVFERLKDDNDAPIPNDDTFYPLYFEYMDMGLTGHANNILWDAMNHGCFDERILLRMIERHLMKDELVEVMGILRIMDASRLYDESIYEMVFEYVAGLGEPGYELLKKLLYQWKEVSHAALEKEYKELIIFASVNSPNKLEPYFVLEYFLDKYPTFHPDGPNHVLGHLLDLFHNGYMITDKIRRVFYRCVARGFRFSDELVNETLLHFYRNVDYQNTFTTFQIMERDVYQVFTEAYVPAIKSALQLGTEESLSIVPRLIMESLIPDDYRVSLIQLMVDIATDPYNHLSLEKELNTIYEYIQLNSHFTTQINAILVDYFLSQDNLEKAKNLNLLTLERFHTEKLRTKPPITNRLEFSPELCDDIEVLTKSPYVSPDGEKSEASTFRFPFDDDKVPPEPKPYEHYIDQDLQRKLQAEISSDEKDSLSTLDDIFGGQTGNNQPDKTTPNVTFSFNYEGQKPDPSKPFFSKFPVDGNFRSTRDEELAHSLKQTKELPKEIYLKDFAVPVSFQPIMSKPKEASALQRDLQMERNQMIETGFEDFSTPTPIDSIPISSFEDVLSLLPKYKTLTQLREERFKRGEDTYEGESSEFEYNAINAIQERNRIPEQVSDIVDGMWENILTYTVVNRGNQEAIELVDETIRIIPFAEPPSRTLCDNLGLPSEWREQYE